MKMGLSGREGALLHSLLGDTAGDKIIRLNSDGFIDRGSDNLADIGFDLSGMLLGPHISDLAEGHYSELVSRHVSAAMRSDRCPTWIEFPVKVREPSSDYAYLDTCRWLALSVKCLPDDVEGPAGAIGLLRSVDRVRRLEDELFANALTHPLTGLVNRNAFLSRLRAELYDGSGGVIALLAIDRMRALVMQYGQKTADEIVWSFAKFLQAMALPGQEVAQIDGERFAIILPGQSFAAARSWTNDLLQTFSSLAFPPSGKTPRLTVSAGMAMIENSVDWTMRQSELALIMASAGGGSQLAHCGNHPMPSIGEIIANPRGQPVALGDQPRRR